MITVPAAYTLGPDTARLTVRTGKTGPASKAGHDLLFEVGIWEAKLDLAAEPSRSHLSVTVDSGSLRVIEGTGGMQALGDDDKSSIKQTIDDEILKRTPIGFSSSSVELGAETLSATGDLELLGRRRPVTFSVSVRSDGHLAGGATVKQTDWGIKPYSILFGTLKVADEVEVAFEGQLT